MYEWHIDVIYVYMLLVVSCTMICYWVRGGGDIPHLYSLASRHASCIMGLIWHAIKVSDPARYFDEKQVPTAFFSLQPKYYLEPLPDMTFSIQQNTTSASQAKWPNVKANVIIISYLPRFISLTYSLAHTQNSHMIHTNHFKAPSIFGQNSLVGKVFVKKKKATL